MNFPLITWQVTAPAFNVDNGGSPVPFASATLWGFEINNTSTLYPTGTSLAGRIIDAIYAVGGTLNSASYNIVNSTNPSLSALTVTFNVNCHGNSILLDFGTNANAAVYGFSSASVLFGPGAAVVLTTTYNPAGVWAPCGVSGDVTRTTKQRAAVSSSDMSGLTTDIVNWGHVADIEVRSTLFPVANAFVWYATQAIYAQKAGRSVNDPNNILEKMLEAAATGVEFRIYEQAATTAGFTNADYLEAKMPAIVGKSAATEFISADDEPRLWSLAGLFFRGNT